MRRFPIIQTMPISRFLLAMFSLGLINAPILRSAETRPNIIMMLVDDFGYGDLSCYPHLGEVSTPQIDQLAQSGVRMMQAYATPVCSPTRTSLLTGRFAERVGVYGNYDGSNPGVGPLRDSFPPLLQAAGYRTAWLGKWHQGWDVSNHPLNNGFDLAFGFLGGMHDYYDATNGDHYIGGPFAPHAYMFDGFRPVKRIKYLTEELTDRAIGFIREEHRSPFFLYLAYNAPHTPFQAPDEVIRKYLKPGVDPVMAVRRAMIEVLDTSVGRVREALRERGLEKDTLVVFMSDNGGDNQSFNGGLRGTKMTAWEGGIRVPLIASWPGKIPAGSVSESICCLPDLPATFLNLARTGEQIVSGDGVDLMPFWTGKHSGNAHEGLVWALEIQGPAGTQPTPDNVALLAVRSGQWKLVRDQKREIDALYNLSADLPEAQDLSKENPEKKTELLAQAAAYLKDCPPSCGLMANRDTRAQGDKIRIQALRAHCKELLGESAKAGQGAQP